MFPVMLNWAGSKMSQRTKKTSVETGAWSVDAHAFGRAETQTVRRR